MYLTIATFFLLFPFAQCGGPTSDELRMQYSSPGTVGSSTGAFVNALPIGNGRLGASLFGQPANEAIIINEDSIWSGPEVNRLNSKALGSLPALRRALLNDDVTEAARIAYVNFTSSPTTSREYQFLADILFTTDHNDYSNYRRTLDLQNATVTISYESGGNAFMRKWFASHPAKLIIGQLSSQIEKGLSFSLQWNRTGLHDGTRIGNISVLSNNSLLLSGGVATGAPHYVGVVSVATSDGTISVANETLNIVNATTVTIYISCETDYWNEGASLTDLASLVNSHISKAKSEPFAKLYNDHTEDFRSFFDRTLLTIESPVTNSSLDIPSRYKAYKSGSPDYGLEALLFHFGRYLMISCSRVGSLPPNLVGIWNPSNSPAWGGKFTTDLNVEMNHWLTETTGLSDMSYQLFEFTRKRVIPNGKTTAKVLYNCSGWVSHHNNDIWGDTAPHDKGTGYTFWPMGGAWPMTHLFEHYRFTGDQTFLKDQALPILTGIVEFYNDFLIEKDGYLLTAPSVSTENSYITPGGVQESIAIGPTADSYFLREILTNFLNASTITGSTYLVHDAQTMLSKIRTPFVPNYYGGIRQWWSDWTEARNTNPMADPILGLYPFAHINFWEQPEDVANVTMMAQESLVHFLAETTPGSSWADVWSIAYWSRLRNSSEAYRWVQNTLKDVVSYSGATWTMNSGNYQIDGNLGYPASIAEMLLQSHGVEGVWPIYILPALPSAWNKGFIQGLGARGGFTVDITWMNGSFQSATILSKLGRELNLTVGKLPAGSSEFYIKELDAVSSNRNLRVQTRRGEKYTLLAH